LPVEIRREDRDGIRVLTLERPPSNELNLALLEALGREVGGACGDAGVRALVLASGLPKYFSSGLDLGELSSLPQDQSDRPFLTVLGVYRELAECGKPVVGALGGTAILGGWILAMGCDYRILAEDARISLSEIRMGLSPTSLLIERLKAISASPLLVKEMVLRGRSLKAAEALAGGLVDRVVPAQSVLGEALSLARGLARMPAKAYASVKRALGGRAGASGGPRPSDPWQAGLDEFRELFGDPATREGLAAMRDKRRPRWEQ
jgi:enoyl-CoA hydratase/carnithine racemase